LADWPAAIAAADVVLDTDLRPVPSAALAAALAAGLPAVLSDTPARRAAAAGRPAGFCAPGDARAHARAIHLAVAQPQRGRSAALDGAHSGAAVNDLNQIYLRLAE
jgi:hypothetical protein